jgi:hypothetical protein
MKTHWLVLLVAAAITAALAVMMLLHYVTLFLSKMV